MTPRKARILQMIGERFSYGEIGKVFGISRQRVHQIATGYRSPAMVGRSTASEKNSRKAA